MSVARRDLLPPLLGVVAILTLVAALVVRPHPLPPGSADFGPIVQVSPPLVPVLGKSYAIDAVVAGDVSGTPVAPVAVTAGTDVHIMGWVLDPRTLSPVDHLLIRIDDGTPQTVYNCHAERPDVANALGVPAAAESGFEAVVSTAVLQPGNHTLSFAAVATDHRTFVLPTLATITIGKR